MPGRMFSQKKYIEPGVALQLTNFQKALIRKTDLLMLLVFIVENNKLCIVSSYYVIAKREESHDNYCVERAGFVIVSVLLLAAYNLSVCSSDTG